LPFTGKKHGGAGLNKIFIILLAGVVTLCADAVYTKNKKANKLYEQGTYEEALKTYDDALLEAPGNKQLQMNKGSTLYRMGQFDKAEENYKTAQDIEDPKVRGAILYDLGNTYNMQGDQLAKAGNQQAMDKYKAARDSYIKALDAQPRDKDSKWNLQLTQQKIKQFEQQQKQQQQQKNNQDKNQKQDKQDQKNQNQDQDKDKKDQDKQQQQDKQDKEKKDQDKEKQQQQQQQQEQQNKDNDQNKEKQAPQPQEQKKQEMEKQQALQLLMQYSDDAKDLNKPQKKMKVAGKKTEKDW
jgi:tetratricopeptide (TPR) repeat protein